MSEQHSPWARPETPVEVTGTEGTYSSEPDQPQRPQRPGAARATVGTGTTLGTGTGTATLTHPGIAPAGAVTRIGEPSPPNIIPDGTDDHDPVRRNKRLLRWFGGGALLVVVIGVVVTLAMIMTGNAGGPSMFNRQATPPRDTRPDLVKNCPPPSGENNAGQIPPTPPGPRTVDEESGISYKAYGAPWEPWPQVWTGGTLRVSYKTGQHIVTERYGEGDYHASILSASVPATVNDALVIDLKCTGRQVAADARTRYYPQPNSIEQLRDEETMLGGRPAWVTKFRLHFHAPGLKAQSELVGLALIAVGRPNAAIIYISIPDTHKQFDYVVDEVLDSVRPA
jgi:hypothetical protein